MRKRSFKALWPLALCLMLTGCQLAQPEAREQPQPVGIWIEAGPAPAAGYTPVIDFDAPGAMGLIMEEYDEGPDGKPVRTYGRNVTHQFLDTSYGSHVTLDVGTADAEESESSFSGTLYLSRNGDAPEDFWLWRVYQGEDGALFTKGEPEAMHIFNMQLEQEGTYTKTFTYETTVGLTGGQQQSERHSYAIGFRGIGTLTRVRIVELDKDFQRLSGVELEIQDDDEYRTRPDTAYVTIAETYVAKGKETTACATYSVSDALDYSGEQALYHTLKYMGPDGIVLPRGLKIVFTGI